MSRYIKHNGKKAYSPIKYAYEFVTPYRIVVTPLPSGRSIRFFVKRTPSKCELDVIEFLEPDIRKIFAHCLENPDIEEKIAAVAPLCNSFANATDHVISYVNKTSVKELKCKIVPFALPVEYFHPNKLNPKNIPTITGIFVAVLIFFLAIIFNVKRIRVWTSLFKFGASFSSRNTSKSHHFSMEDIEQQASHTKETRKDSIRKVMILNRPGCELIETLLRDLAFFLKAYGIDVKLSLLEQSQIDAEGGISSYLQRNIDSCDYILIMFTEHDKEHTSLKHRPYEFALKVISGLAYHQNDSSRYIPLYLTSYEKALSLMPSFFIGSHNFGYKLPKDITKLLRHLLHSTDLSNSKDMAAKLEYFTNKTKATCKRIEAKHHYCCCKEDCMKGMLYGSVSNLSSVWASTKWSSSCSVDLSKEENFCRPLQEETDFKLDEMVSSGTIS
ncbi:uncharacterized protein LOC130655029 [Hydractinia symbiolongicarpus]|uniref:uncharacterized protein LOC130655029 n=1 Tax=Hydractinia symbiolongicarpus TaxID=13093 RepID=UPI00254CCD56|nr:uncharacterized protein LOC130655029 [Hydractinia symbiolongicarpus]